MRESLDFIRGCAQIITRRPVETRALQLDLLAWAADAEAKSELDVAYPDHPPITDHIGLLTRAGAAWVLANVPLTPSAAAWGMRDIRAISRQEGWDSVDVTAFDRRWVSMAASASVRALPDVGLDLDVYWKQIRRLPAYRYTKLAPEVAGMWREAWKSQTGGSDVEWADFITLAPAWDGRVGELCGIICSARWQRIS